MSPNAIVVMLYAELGMFLGGLACLLLARMLQTRGANEGATGDNAPRSKPGFVLSRLGA